jgi:hypothetical protein
MNHGEHGEKLKYKTAPPAFPVRPVSPVVNRRP